MISSIALQSPRFLFCTQPKHCVCSFFLTAAYGCLVDHTVNFTSPVPLHLLMRERVWLAESSSLAHRGQNSLGRVEKINSFAYETIHGCWSYCLPLQLLPSDVILSIHYCAVMLATVLYLTSSVAYYPQDYVIFFSA